MLFEPIKPMLLQTNDVPFDDTNWLHELKLDGWRILLHKQGERVEAFTRHGTRLTGHFPELREVASAIRSYEAILDCEGVCYRDGKTVFEDFAYRGRVSRAQKIVHAARAKPVSFVAFDVLYDGQDRPRLPLIERKERMSELVQSNSVLSTVVYLDGDNGTALFTWVEQNGWEGTVSKLKTSLYSTGVRSTEWVKTKVWRQVDTVVMGYRFKPTFALLVGTYMGDQLRVVAAVELGLNAEVKKAVREVSRSIATTRTDTVQWVEPVICARIRYRERTERGALRMAVLDEFLFGRKPSMGRGVKNDVILRHQHDRCCIEYGLG